MRTQNQSFILQRLVLNLVLEFASVFIFDYEYVWSGT